MNPAAKLAGFVVVLALVFGGATAAGRALDPFGDEPVRTEHDGGHSPAPTAPEHGGDRPAGSSTTSSAPHPSDHDVPATTSRPGRSDADDHQDHEGSEP